MSAQPASLPEYGLPISLENAKKVMAAAEAESAAQHWNMAIAIVDSGGNLVMLHKMDQTQHASIKVAQKKAETAVNFRRPTKVFEDVVAAGGLGLRMLSMSDLVIAVEGGIPLLQGGKVIGAIGVSGMQAPQDAQVALAGAKALED